MPLLVFPFPPAVSLATTLIVHEPNNAALLSYEIFRFTCRPASLSKQADQGVAHATENVVGSINDEGSTERGMELVGEAQLAQGHGEATAGSVIGCLGEEATSDGRVGRGGGGNEGLGEGGEEGQFQKLFATAIGTSLPTNSLPQSSPALSPNPSSGSTLHSRA